MFYIGWRIRPADEAVVRMPQVTHRDHEGNNSCLATLLLSWSYAHIPCIDAFIIGVSPGGSLQLSG
jgi:hypothetical protein